MLVEILGLALLAALWPALVAVVLVALASPHPVTILASFLAGGLLTTTALGLAIVFSLEASDLLTGERPPTPAAIDLVVGVLVLVVAVVAWRTEWTPRRRPKRDPSDREPPWTERMLSRGTGRIAFLVGLVINLVPGLFAVVGYKDIAELDISKLEAVALVVAFNVIMFTLVEVPLAGYLVAPRWTEERVRRLNAWLRGHGREAVVAVATPVGVYLIVRGLLGLL